MNPPPMLAPAWRLIPTVVVAACVPTAVLAEGSGDAAAEYGAFVQYGKAGSTEMAVFGLTRDWQWRKPWGDGVLTGFWELSIGRWSSDNREGGNSSAWVTQIGATPVLRWYPGGAAANWFVEGGIGANLLTPIYRSANKRFSTTFNFGDHLAVGWRYGESAQREVALRVQHFSNAGIRQPNPGENFVQLRYTVKF